MPSIPKEWKSYQDQIEILQSRGMIIDDADEAEHCLKRIGYYRLSGYSYPFRQYDQDNRRALDNFKEGTKFSDITNLYNFDRKLRLLALDAIERIELAIQVEIAYLLGERNKFAHLEPNELHGNFTRIYENGSINQHQKWVREYNGLVDRAIRKPFVTHNLNKYGKLPIWVAIEILDFGRLSKLYAGMKIQDRITIEQQFGLISGQDFKTWLRGFNFIRNTCAHHGRLWNCNVLERADIPQNMLNLGRLNNARPFLYFCMIQSVLKVICPASQWKEEFINLMDNFPTPQNNAISTEGMGVVSGWKNWKMWNTEDGKRKPMRTVS
jgi:abortive infection bacteriophage resistance protein